MPTHKQGSKSMGEKIANPDYADPSKLFPNSCSSSTTNLSIHEIDAAESLVYDMMGEPEELDMTINEKDVLKEIDERLKERSTLFSEKPVPDTGQVFSSSVHTSSHNNCGNKTVLSNKSDSKIKSFNSSQNSDSFYEAIMEKNLNEENSPDVTAKKEFDQINGISKETKNRTNVKPTLKRPTKAPPPIPVKPKGLANLSNDKLKNGLHVCSETNSKTFVSIKSTIVNGEPNSRSSIQTNGTYSRSWVKAMVGRFDDENNN